MGNFYTPQLGGLWSRPTSKREDKARLGQGRVGGPHATCASRFCLRGPC